MKTFIKSGILFLIIFFILEKSSYFILKESAKNEYDQRLEYILRGEMNKDVIILGSSRGAGNILANQLTTETGLNTYNLSYPGSHILFHQFIFTILLKHNKAPKKLIYVVDNPYVFLDEPSLVFRLERLYPLSQYNEINNKLIQMGEHSLLSKYFVLGRLHRSNFTFKKEKPPEDRPMSSNGSYPYILDKKNKTWTTFNDMKSFNQNLELPEKVKAFNSIQARCKENNIQLVIVFSPDYIPFNDAFSKRIKSILYKENRMMIYDRNNLKYKDEHYFYDESHLNIKGAKIFTTEISTFMNQNK